jgi:hypothetical protein
MPNSTAFQTEADLVQALREHVAAYLPLDPRFWDKLSGEFEFAGHLVWFFRMDDCYYLEMGKHQLNVELDQ